MTEIILFCYLLLSPYLMALSVIDTTIMGFKLSTIVPMLLWLASFAFLLIRTFLKGRFIWDGSLFLLFLFFVFSGIKFVISGSGQGSDLLFISASWFVLYWISISFRFERVNWKRWGAWFECSGILAVVLGILLYHLNIPLYSKEYVGSDQYYAIGDKYRAMSTFVNPNAFAYFILMFYLFLLFRRGKYFILKLILLIYALYLTYSRSALAIFLILVCFEILILFVRYIRGLSITKDKQVKYMLVGSIAVILLVMAGLLYYNYILNGFLRVADIVNNPRWEKWGVAIEYLLSSPMSFIFGNDLGVAIQSGDVSFSDNQFLYISVFYGMFGFLILSFLYVLNFLNALRSYSSTHNHRNYKRINKIIIMILVLYGLMAAISNISLIFPITFYVPIVIGMLNRYRRQMNIETREGETN